MAIMQSSYYNIFVSLLVIFMLKIDLRLYLLFLFFSCYSFMTFVAVYVNVQLRGYSKILKLGGFKCKASICLTF